jgi:hypothetical protein
LISSLSTVSLTVTEPSWNFSRKLIAQITKTKR